MKLLQFRRLPERLCSLVVATFFLPVTALAEPVSAQYGVSISGFPIGRVTYEGEVDRNEYRIQGFMGSSGFFGFFIGARYSGAVIGEFRGGQPRPSIFRGRFEQRRKFAQVDIRYKNGRPVEIVRIPPREPQPEDATSAQAAGHLDPISALYFMLVDRKRQNLCRQDFRIFEGSRTARIGMARLEPSDDAEPTDAVVCQGIYRRMDGFTEEQLEERRDYPFLMTYLPNDDGTYFVSEFVATTDYGTARAVRRR